MIGIGSIRSCANNKLAEDNKNKDLAKRAEEPKDDSKGCNI
jgi:hypothetical protein